MNWKPERAWFLLLEVGRFNLYCTHLYGFKGFKPKTTEAHWRRLFILILNSSSKNSMLFRTQPWRRFCNNWYWSFIFEFKISSKRISQLTCLSDFNFWFFFFDFQIIYSLSRNQIKWACWLPSDYETKSSNGCRHSWNYFAEILGKPNSEKNEAPFKVRLEYLNNLTASWFPTCLKLSQLPFQILSSILSAFQ